MRAVTAISKSLYAIIAAIGGTIVSLTDALNDARAQSARFSRTHW